MIKQLTDADKMPFGKYEGRTIMLNVPAEYLHSLWISGIQKNTQKDRQQVVDYIKRNMSALKLENPNLIWE